MVKKWSNSNNVTNWSYQRTQNSNNETDGTLARQEKQSRTCTGTQCRVYRSVNKPQQILNVKRQIKRAFTHRRSTTSHTHDRASTRHLPCLQPTIFGFVFFSLAGTTKLAGGFTRSVTLILYFCTSKESRLRVNKNNFIKILSIILIKPNQKILFILNDFAMWTSSASPSTGTCTMHLLRSIYWTLRCTVQYCNQVFH